MTGKRLHQPNKFVIQLTPNYRIMIDRLNCTLMTKKSKVKVEDIMEDEEVDNGYLPIGYFPSNHPESLVREIMKDHIVSEGSKNALKLDEFVELYKSYLDNLCKRIGKVTNHADGLTVTIEEQADTIKALNKENRIMKGQITRLRKK